MLHEQNDRLRKCCFPLHLHIIKVYMCNLYFCDMLIMLVFLPFIVNIYIDLWLLFAVDKATLGCGVIAIVSTALV